jgi:hypothetical protein
LRTNGTLIDRNDMNIPAIHRIDLRLQRRFKLGNFATFDGMFEVFNLLNHANYNTFNNNLASAVYNTPVRDANLAYAPRMVQLGFRMAF